MSGAFIFIMTNTSTITLLYVTCSNIEEAELIASTLLEKRLIACANILSGMQSLYRWEGKVEQSTETVMIVKTTQDNASATHNAIVELHSYECPCILEIPVSGGHEPFLTWLQEQSLN